MSRTIPIRPDNLNPDPPPGPHPAGGATPDTGPTTLAELEALLRSLHDDERDADELLKGAPGYPVALLAGWRDYVRQHFGVAEARRRCECVAGYDGLRTHVLRNTTFEMTKGACAEVRRQLVRGGLTAAQADRLTLPEVVARLNSLPRGGQLPGCNVVGGGASGPGAEGAARATGGPAAGLCESARVAFERYDQGRRALREKDGSREYTDLEIHDYLESEGSAPQNFETWSRYVRLARKHFGIPKHGSRSGFESRSAEPVAHQRRRPD